MTRCPLCPGINCTIPPDGPLCDGGVLFIGEAPGKDENRLALKHPPGRPFVGKTGQEVDRHYLPLAGIRRHETCFTNAIRCLPATAGGKLDASDKKDLALLDSCASFHLYPLIERSQARVLVPLGAFACRAVCPGVDLETQHGHPVETPWGIPAFPMYHPALGIYEPKKMLHIRTDWQRLRRYLNGTLLLPFDGFPDPDYHEVEDESEIYEIDPQLPLAADTESKRSGSPYCLTYSQQPGTGRLIRAERQDLLQTFQRVVSRGNGPILFHNWFYDWTVVEAMELQLDPKRIVDTMAWCFHLGNLPQGLKALALRELGMEMEDFEDLVTPYSRRLVLRYYEQAKFQDWPKPAEETVIDDKTGMWKIYKPQGMNTKLKRFHTDLMKNPEGKDVFKAWENWESSQAMIEEQLGPWPGKCISHVPFEKTLYYACRDSDALIRLYPILRRMRQVVRRFSQDRWREQVA